MTAPDQPPIFSMHEGGNGAGVVTGRKVLDDIYDLIRRALPKIPIDDPARPYLTAALPALGDELGRPRVVAVPPSRPQQDEPS